MKILRPDPHFQPGAGEKINLQPLGSLPVYRKHANKMGKIAPFSVALKKYLGVNLVKEVRFLYNEKFKTLKK